MVVSDEKNTKIDEFWFLLGPNRSNIKENKGIFHLPSYLCVLTGGAALVSALAVTTTHAWHMSSYVLKNRTPCRLGLGQSNWQIHYIY